MSDPKLRSTINVNLPTLVYRVFGDKGGHVGFVARESGVKKLDWETVM